MKIYLYPNKPLNYSERQLSNLDKWSLDEDNHQSKFLCSFSLLENRSEYFVVDADETVNKWLISAFKKDDLVSLGKKCVASNLVESYHNGETVINNLFFKKTEGTGKHFKMPATMYSENYKNNTYVSSEDGVTSISRISKRYDGNSFENTLKDFSHK